jgi:hypothetical protein
MKLTEVCVYHSGLPFARQSNPDINYCIHPDMVSISIGYRPIFIRVKGDKFSSFSWQPTGNDLLVDDWVSLQKPFDGFWQVGKYKNVDYWADVREE